MAERASIYYYDDNRYRAEAAEFARSGSGQRLPEERPQIEMRRTEVRSGSVIAIILGSLVAAVLLGSVIYSLDKRNTAYNKVAALNEQLSLAEAENVRLQSELESRMSAKHVEEYAENVLGMKKIDSSQITYIRIQTDDVVSIPQQDDGLIAKVKRFFESCVEYFRG